MSDCNVEDLGSIPWLGRSPGEGHGNPLQYSCLETPMDGEDWKATVHGVPKSQTRLSDVAERLHFHFPIAKRSWTMNSMISWMGLQMSWMGIWIN